MNKDEFISESNSNKEYISRTAQELEAKIKNIDAKLDAYVSKNALLKYLENNEKQWNNLTRRVDDLGSLDLSTIVTQDQLGFVKSAFDAKLNQQPAKLAQVVDIKIEDCNSQISKIASTQITKDKLYDEISSVRSAVKGMMGDYQTIQGSEEHIEAVRSSIHRQQGDLSKRIDSVSKTIPTNYATVDALKSVKNEAVKKSLQAIQKTEVLEERVTKSVQSIVDFSTKQIEAKVNKSLKQLEDKAEIASSVRSEWDTIKDNLEEQHTSASQNISSLQDRVSNITDDLENVMIDKGPEHYKLWAGVKDMHILATKSKLDRLAEIQPETLEALKKVEVLIKDMERLNKSQNTIATISSTLKEQISGYEGLWLKTSKTIDDVKTRLENAGLKL